MSGAPCPVCGKDSFLLSTTNEWKYHCEQHGRFNESGVFHPDARSAERSADNNPQQLSNSRGGT